MCLFFLFLFVLTVLQPAAAQFDFTPQNTVRQSAAGPRLGKSIKQIWRAGIIISPGAELHNVVLTLPVPMDWYEQKILSINEEKTEADIAAGIEYNIINNGAKELTLRLGNVSGRKPVQVVLAFELENYELLPPENTKDYVIAKKVPKDIQPYLRESPKIESENQQFTKLFRDITKERATAWDKVEALYSYVQNNVKYDDNGWKRPARGAMAVLKMTKGEWTGDCKDMSCLFVALCRAGHIPARIVRVPDHCYPEFYLEVKQSKEQDTLSPQGYWFPCQISGTYAFGGIPERRVILQKGDSFPDTDNPRTRSLWLKECFSGTCPEGGALPKFKWIHETAAVYADGI